MSDKIIHLTDDSFDTDVLKADGLILVDFWAEWCGPCKMIAPILDEIADEYQGKLTVAKLNIDQNPGTAPMLYGPKASGAWPTGFSMKGVTGYTTATGSTVTIVSGAATATATCASGWKVVAGGYLLNGSPTGAVITENRASSDMVWTVTVGGSSAGSLQATAYCIFA
jgi:thiol-disulfide isomerase/thioredoxin